MEKITLVILAAGMGSRFGGLKQIEPVDPEGHIIIDFSLFDAWRAGFRDVVFIIKREMEAEFRECIGDRMEQYFHVSYVYQDLDRLPEGIEAPEGRTKPWETGHALACCKGVVNGPFAVINADDFYGRTAFSEIYDFLAAQTDESKYAMVGYRLKNTVTEFGSVARGVCEIEDGMLTGVTERTKIFKKGTDAEYTEDGEHFFPLAGDTIVSMNLWGFSARVLDELWARMGAFLTEAMKTNPLKCEYFLPFVVNEQRAGAAVRGNVVRRDLPRGSGICQGSRGQDEGGGHLYGGALEMNENLFEVLRAFRLDAKPVSCEPYGCGHINVTYLAVTESGLRYILQKINNNTFRDVAGLMENITAVTEFLRTKTDNPRGVLTLVKTHDGASYLHAQDAYWRVYDFVEDSICLQLPETDEDFYQSAVGFGTFQ